jgi:hypothetical protein
LIWYGFVKDYTVWKFHSEANPSTGASGGNSSTSTAMVNTGHDGRQPSSSVEAAGRHDTASSNNADHDYIMMDDLLQDMAHDDGGGGSGDGDGEPADVMDDENITPSCTRQGEEEVQHGRPIHLPHGGGLVQLKFEPISDSRSSPG